MENYIIDSWSCRNTYCHFDGYRRSDQLFGADSDSGIDYHDSDTSLFQ
ncbi:MAG: CxxxxCH/CxxCH domain-containing protein [Lachnospiraceae bacterium]